MTAFTREAWAALPGADHPDLTAVAASVLDVPADEIEAVYLPLARLLWVVGEARQRERQQLACFLGQPDPPGPFMVGLTGGVSVGKSTTARLLQALLQALRADQPVAVLTTDSFLHSNQVLEARGLAGRKGFPESFDRDRLLGTLAAVRAGTPEVRLPVYTHLVYDVVPGAALPVGRPAVVIVEGLNVLQWPGEAATLDRQDPAGDPEVSDLLDWSIYVDADEGDMARWFIERVLRLRAQAVGQPEAYFHRFVDLSEEELSAFAAQVWDQVNLVNLRQNVLPTRPRAHLVLEKDRQQRVNRVLVQRV